MKQASDAEYLEIITGAIRVCGDYRPRLGHGRAAGFTLAEFQDLYQTDPFYSWFGLDNPLMYAAHRAAGGITSVYRQIGIGCQWLFNRILRDSLNLDEEAANWSYRVPGAGGGRQRTLSLDARIPTAAVPAFAQLDAPARAALLETVRAETEPTIRRYRDADLVTFPMFAHVAVAII